MTAFYTISPLLPMPPPLGRYAESGSCFRLWVFAFRFLVVGRNGRRFVVIPRAIPQCCVHPKLSADKLSTNTAPRFPRCRHSFPFLDFPPRSTSAPIAPRLPVCRRRSFRRTTPKIKDQYRPQQPSSRLFNSHGAF